MSPMITDFDEVFVFIGGFGPYQYIIFTILCCFTVLYSFLYFGQIFMVLTPPHWCRPPDGIAEGLRSALGVNLTNEEVLRLTIPPSPNGVGFDTCRRYDVDFHQIGEYDGNVSWPTVPCDWGWEYNFTSFYPSITSELNWVCEDDWKPPFSQTCFFIGSLVGIPLFGWLADYFGRLPIIVATNGIAGVFGIASSFCNSFIVFCIFRLVVGMCFDSNYLIIYILGLEYVSSEYRTVVANVPIMLFLTLPLCLMPWMAYFLHDWSKFGLVIHIPMLFALGIPFIIPESVRWLISKGKSHEAFQIVKKAAKINGKTLPKNFSSDFEDYLQRSASEATRIHVTCLDLLKTPILRKRFLALIIMWVAISIAYDGYLRITEKMDFDFFIAFTIMGAVELPADFFTILLMEKVGRKNTVMWTLLSTGIVALSLVLVDQNATLETIILSATGRFLVTMSINVGLQYILEVIPTVGRAQGSGVIHTFGYGMVFVSPYIVYLSKYKRWIPYFIFGIVSIIGGCSSLFLPETMGEKLPDTLKDGEEFFRNQPTIYNPFKKEKQNQETDGQRESTKF